MVSILTKNRNFKVNKIFKVKYFFAFLLFCGHLFHENVLHSYPIRVTQMYNPQTGESVDFLHDIHVEIFNIQFNAQFQTPDTTLTAYTNVLADLAIRHNIALVWEHTQKIYLLPGHTYEMYNEPDLTNFFGEVVPNIPLPSFFETAGLTTAQQQIFQHVFNIYTGQNNPFFRKPYSEAPISFMDKLALNLRQIPGVNITSSNEERSSMIILYQILYESINEIQKRISKLVTKKATKNTIPHLKAHICQYLAVVVILIHKTLLNQTMPDRILANMPENQHSYALRSMWKEHKEKIRKFYNTEFVELSKMLLQNPNEDMGFFNSLKFGLNCGQHFKRFYGLNALITYSVVEFEFLFNLFSQPSAKKIVYAGTIHCDELMHKLQRMGFVCTKEIGRHFDPAASTRQTQNNTLDVEYFIASNPPLPDEEVFAFLATEPNQEYQQGEERYYLNWNHNFEDEFNAAFFRNTPQ